MSIDDDANLVLLAIAGYEQTPGDPQRGRYSLDGDDLIRVSGLNADRLNDAVELLDQSGYVEVRRFIGTTPFDFGHVGLTAQGRREAERLRDVPSLAAPPPDSIPTPPAASTRFEAIERIGEGVYGEVWRARDLLLNRLVAIKFVRSSSVEHDALAHARALARVSHQNIVAVYDVVELLDPVSHLPAYAVVMELVEGPTLLERLGRTMTAGDTGRIGHALLDAVDAYHQAGLAHMDLHAGNVIIGDAVVKVLDPLYLATGDFRSTATRENQQARDARDLRDLLVQMLHLGAVPIEAAQQFERETIRPIAGHLRRVFDDVLVNRNEAATPAPEVVPRPSARSMLERALTQARSRAVVLVGGVTELVGNRRRNALQGEIHVGRQDDLSFELRIPVGLSGIPILSVPYGMLREAWVDAAGRLNVLLTSQVVWNGRELEFTDPFVR